MKFIKHALAAIAALAIITPALASTTPLNPKAAPQLERSTADHSKFKELQQTFTSGPEVTKACLACHNTAGHQVMKSIHWTWEANSPTTGKKLGKKWAANNFCGSIISNETRCTSCHAGYGWKDKDYDFTDQNNVDCLACHDTTGTYKKFGTDAGHPLYADREFEPMEGPPGKKQFKAPDLSKIAQHVGQPGRGNCGACHFNGGGGDAVKHGDLDSSLKNPSRELDVHMAKDGANMVCSDCHTFNAHQPSGSRYAATSKDKHGLDLPKDDHNHATCESCHGFTPHKEAKINNHTNKVACQTCHIPEFARGGIATKTLWDWSTAGKMDANGKPLFIKDDHGHLKYSAAKGDFAYGENVRPEYKWYNGVVHQIAITDKLDGLLDAKGVLELNRVEGSAKDPNARIWPFKVMHGKQPYDTGNNTLVVNHVYGDDDTSLWRNYDYSKSIKAGMEYAGLPYSGQFGFIETRMNWFITHMVAPKEKAVPCQECHTRAADGRLAAITDIYLPGRDTKGWLDLLGGLMIAGAIGGGVLHGGIRIATRRKEKAKMSNRIYIYKRYERFWHWSQALLIITMMITGFEVHGSYLLLGFKKAVQLHTLAAWTLLTLWAFTIFWQFTTGEWRQYLPSLKNVGAMIKYYTVGIFTNSPHPFRKTVVQKHNPLQRLAYLALLAFISPLIWGSGLFYLFYGDWARFGLDQSLSLEAIATLHVLGAYMITAFFFIHVYLTTTGHTVFAHIKAMITGWEEEEHETPKGSKAH